MKLKKFYSSRLEGPILDKLDIGYERVMGELIRKLDEDDWTEKQKKCQKTNILPKIALYKTFIRFGVPKDRAKELVREFAYDRAQKFHNILTTFFKVPRFSKAFRLFMRKGMAGDEIWHSRILSDDDESFAMDVTKCLWNDTCIYFDCPELCEVFCNCDHIMFGNIEKLEFLRSQTLGTDGSKCDFDFRFRKHQ